MPGTSKDHLESNEEVFEFEGFKTILMKTISINTQLFFYDEITKS